VIVKLSLGEIEQARLVLRGGSIIDWRRLDVASMDECNAILCANGFDPEDAIRAAVYPHASVWPVISVLKGILHRCHG
jgi:hypothetical protein